MTSTVPISLIFRSRLLLALALVSVPQLLTVSRAEMPKPDIVVAADGTGAFKTIQEAVDTIPKDNRERKIIFIKDGLYHEKVRIDPDFVTLRGESRQGARIEFAQGADEFTKNPDNIGRAVVNINGNDCVLQDLTIKNTQGVIGPHAFAVYGKGDKTVITDCDVLSQGADTLALWGDQCGSYQARLNIRGSVDFVCPRGWCYMTDCTFYEVNPAAHASIWHDGNKDKDMKFVLRNCKFDGVEDFVLARHHHDAEFFLLDCTFSIRMRDLAPYRVVYPIAGDKPSPNDAKRNKDLDAGNLWGERAYFYNCHRDGGDYSWFANNLSSAPGAPQPDQITAAWTFAGKWNPERTDAPQITKIERQSDRIQVTFSENVTVKGEPRLTLRDGGYAEYASGSGGTQIVFTVRIHSEQPSDVTELDLHGGTIMASEASANLRMVEGLPQSSPSDPIAPIKAPFPMPQLQRPAFPDHVVDIRDYGAVEGGTVTNTAAFAKAIQTCASKGGGRVLVPAGRWLTGPIHLQSNIELHLAQGAEVIFSDRFRDYLPPVFVRVGGIELYNYSPLIYARNCENVAITGPGRLNGNAKAWWDWKGKETKEFFQMAARGVPVEKRVFGTPEAAIRPSFVSFVNCKNVLLEGFTIGSGPNWTIHPVYCENVIVRHVTVDTDGPNNDGIDPDSCRNVLIEYCTFSTGDDCVVLKSGYNEDGWRVHRPTENVVMRYCSSQRGHGGLVVGSEMSGDVRNVYMHDCDFDGTDRAVRIKSLRGRGGVVENIWAENLKVKNMQREVVVLNMDYGSDRNPASNLKSPVFRNMVIRNVVGHGAPTAVLLQGLDDSPIENIQFEDLTITSTKGVICKNVKKLNFKNVIVTPSQGPVFDMTNASQIEIRRAKAPPGTYIFLQLEGKDSHDVRIEDSDLIEAKLMFMLGDDVPVSAITVK